MARFLPHCRLLHCRPRFSTHAVLVVLHKKRGWFLVAQSTPGQVRFARASDTVAGAASGGLGPLRPCLISLAEYDLKPKLVTIVLADL